ncbi:hypothetical protein LTR91_016053 [Friedmanniomyces endolithicus]|uniref:Uncharacterized protein n=2 Tax=Dothideomycetidae TaxID=451867 RepID=A0AAN6K8N5_9PEZI|nr:hypothetical protein LTR75_005327 [Friedmanniomyces endolithicus]KAK5140811.1 hypothetical protein LTR32_006483 [Rachicladosporium monterosium]KAK0844501.1 hypothetical protein LTR03_008017 [Friedmanniomyces endolithicus]KAK0861658.1 hypothetical protein LTS02_007667 [Friedmanniomyces endolithicus]KAK0875182.1 hypothetical protein LTR87_011006 [Friedmanniomyces endolithicus]
MAAPSTLPRTAFQNFENLVLIGSFTDRELVDLQDVMLRNPEQTSISSAVYRLLLEQIEAAERRIAAAAAAAARRARRAGMVGR